MTNFNRLFNCPFQLIFSAQFYPTDCNTFRLTNRNIYVLKFLPENYILYEEYFFPIIFQYQKHFVLDLKFWAILIFRIASISTSTIRKILYLRWLSDKNVCGWNEIHYLGQILIFLTTVVRPNIRLMTCI